MGASLSTGTYKLDSNYKDRWNSDVEQSQHESGHSYSGEIGMLGKGFDMSSHIAEDTNEAHDYICDHHDKWDGAMAVKTKDGFVVIGGWCSS